MAGPGNGLGALAQVCPVMTAKSPPDLGVRIGGAGSVRSGAVNNKRLPTEKAGSLSS
jgi:hypothetical protein